MVDHATPHPTILAHRFAEALNRHDLAILGGVIADQYVNHNPYVEDGLAANQKFWAQWLTAFPDTQVTVEDAFASPNGDRVVGRFTYRATHTGAFLGSPPTGLAVEMRSIDIWRVEDGRFVEHWDEINALGFFGQIGALPGRA